MLKGDVLSKALESIISNASKKKPRSTGRRG
jgi:hypothetical protein